MAKTLQWKCDVEIPITMLINTFKHIETHTINALKYIIDTLKYYKYIQIHSNILCIDSNTP
jgi:hypothetical protein